LARREAIRNAVPSNAWAEFGEFVAGVTAGKHVKDGFEHRTREIGVGCGGADELKEVVNVPFVEGNDGDDLLGEDVERVAWIVDAFDLALIHRLGDGGAGDEVGAIFRIDEGVADSADVMAGAADALHAAGDGWRRFDLNDEIDGAHVDAEFERRCGDETAECAEFEAVFDFLALRDGDAAVVCADQRFLRKIVDGAGDAFGEAAIIDEDESGAMGTDLLEELRMDGAPDGWANGALRGGAARERIDVVEASHVFDGDFDPEVEAFEFAGVDDGDGAVNGSVEGGFEFGEGLVRSGSGGLGVGVEAGCRLLGLWRSVRKQIPAFGWNDGGWYLACCGDFGAAEEAGDFFEWALGGREADALDAAAGEFFEAFECEREMGAALGGDESVDFVEDDGVDGTQQFAGLRRQ